MKPRRTHLSNQVFRLAGGTEDNDLWTWVDVAAGTVSSVWELSAEERVWGGQPPVAMRVVDTPVGKPSSPREASSS